MSKRSTLSLSLGNRAALALCLWVLACSALGQDEGIHKGSWIEVKENGLSFRYSTNDFGAFTVNKKPKLTAEENGTDIPLAVGPERIVVMIEDKRPLPALDKGPRYFLPTQSVLAVIPLSDPSSKNFAEDYPQIQGASASLKQFLKEKPRTIGPAFQIPDLPFIEASQAIHSKVQDLDFPSFSGVSFLTQYTQEDLGNPVNNEELTLNFQGLTPDGRYYVAARFAVTHPSLPSGIDDAALIRRDEKGQYLREAEKSLNDCPEESFTPSLNRLKDILKSMSISG